MYNLRARGGNIVEKSRSSDFQPRKKIIQEAQSKKMEMTKIKSPTI